MPFLVELHVKRKDYVLFQTSYLRGIATGHTDTNFDKLIKVRQLHVSEYSRLSLLSFHKVSLQYVI